MAKAILEYDLNDPDDSMAHRRAVKSTDMAIVLFEIENNLHRRIEMGIDVEQYKTPYEVSVAYREAIIDLLIEQGINTEELIR